MNSKMIRIMTNFGRTDQAKAMYDNIVAMLQNAQAHNLTFIDEKTRQAHEPEPNRITQIVYAGFTADLWVKDTNNILFKIDLIRTPTGDYVSLYPLDPYKKKQGIDCQEEGLDLAFYIERILELCEGFVIWEFIAE
jgi:hypothetical protein